MGHQASCPLQPQRLARQSLLEDIEDAIFVPFWLCFSPDFMLPKGWKRASRTVPLRKCYYGCVNVEVVEGGLCRTQEH